jgi:hypothetical protein
MWIRHLKGIKFEVLIEVQAITRIQTETVEKTVVVNGNVE